MAKNKKPPKPPKAPPRNPDPPSPAPSNPDPFVIKYSMLPGGEAKTILAIAPGVSYWGAPFSPAEVTELLKSRQPFKNKLRLFLLSEMASLDHRVGAACGAIDSLIKATGPFVQGLEGRLKEIEDRLSLIEEIV